MFISYINRTFHKETRERIGNPVVLPIRPSWIGYNQSDPSLVGMPIEEGNDWLPWRQPLNRRITSFILLPGGSAVGQAAAWKSDEKWIHGNKWTRVHRTVRFDRMLDARGMALMRLFLTKCRRIRHVDVKRNFSDDDIDNRKPRRHVPLSVRYRASRLPAKWSALKRRCDSMSDWHPCHQSARRKGDDWHFEYFMQRMMLVLYLHF